MGKEQENGAGSSPLEPVVMCRSVKQVAEYLANYWATYEQQHLSEQYSAETVLNDALYGIGAALSDDYKFAPGFAKFKKDLIKHLGT
jgi:hypothetical protein